MSAAAVGTATHALLQLLPLEMPTTESIHQKLQELVRKRLVDEKSRKSRCFFYYMVLSNRTWSTADCQQRKRKTRTTFSMLLPADEVFQDYPNQEDELLIHGIVDGYLEEKIISISMILKQILFYIRMIQQK